MSQKRVSVLSTTTSSKEKEGWFPRVLTDGVPPSPIQRISGLARWYQDTCLPTSTAGRPIPHPPEPQRPMRILSLMNATSSELAMNVNTILETPIFHPVPLSTLSAPVRTLTRSQRAKVLRSEDIAAIQAMDSSNSSGTFSAAKDDTVQVVTDVAHLTADLTAPQINPAQVAKDALALEHDLVAECHVCSVLCCRVRARKVPPAASAAQTAVPDPSAQSAAPPAASK